jgi:hypothetical protein
VNGKKHEQLKLISDIWASRKFGDFDFLAALFEMKNLQSPIPNFG